MLPKSLKSIYNQLTALNLHVESEGRYLDLFYGISVTFLLSNSDCAADFDLIYFSFSVWKLGKYANMKKNTNSVKDL